MCNYLMLETFMIISFVWFLDHQIGLVERRTCKKERVFERRSVCERESMCEQKAHCERKSYTPLSKERYRKVHWLSRRAVCRLKLSRQRPSSIACIPGGGGEDNPEHTVFWINNEGDVAALHSTGRNINLRPCCVPGTLLLAVSRAP